LLAIKVISFELLNAITVVAKIKEAKRNLFVIRKSDLSLPPTVGLDEELILAFLPVRTAAKFIIKSSLLLMSPNL
jgi:hypothetical protein